jgi:hypothetical protein
MPSKNEEKRSISTPFNYFFQKNTKALTMLIENRVICTSQRIKNKRPLGATQIFFFEETQKL